MRILVVSMIALLCTVFAASYVRNETPGYYWDFVGYYDQLRQLTDVVGRGDWKELLHALALSRSSEYNVSPVLLLLPIALILGVSRQTYILSFVLLYLIPACIVLVILIQECWKEFGRGISFLLGLGFVLLYPMFWAPTLRGYPDIAAFIPMGLAGVILLRSRWIVRASAGQSIWVGLLLWCTFVLRRHYAYTIMSIIVVTLLFAGWQVLKARGIRMILLRSLLRNVLLAGAALLLAAVIFQGPLLQRIVATSYGSVYSAYQQGLQDKLMAIYERNGLFWIFLAASGCLYAAYLRNSKALYCCCIAVLSYFLFQRTQAPDIHHNLPFAFWLAPLAAWPLTLINSQASAIRRAGLGALLLGLLSAISLPVLAWGDIQRSPLLGWSKPFQAKKTFPPFRINSYPALMDLVKELEGPQYAGKKILILASSYELNPSILKSLRPDMAPRFLEAGHVDLRDGFSLEAALNADYIITTKEPSLHLPAEHQQVIVIPVRVLSDPTNPLSQFYTRNPDLAFNLADGNTAYVFKRISRPSEEAINWLISEFHKTYPTWQEKDGRLSPNQP